jgi:hypothetical protein
LVSITTAWSGQAASSSNWWSSWADKKIRLH